MSADERRPPSPAAERRLDEHLSLLRKAEDESAGRSLPHRVVRVARAQRLVRAPLQVAGTIAAGILDGIAGLLGMRRRSG